MANDTIHKRRISISHTGGNFDLKRVESFKPDHDTTLTIAKSTEGPIGYHEDDNGGSITLSVFAETGTPEVNYYRLYESKEKFVFTTQDVGGDGVATGHRIQYRAVRVEKIGAPTENNGKQMIEVSCKFLSFKVMR